MADLPSKQAIEHIVVLMLENRSFDSVLGSLPGVDGLSPAMFNPDSKGTRIPVGEATSTITESDPLHDLKSVLDQLIGPNQGFVVNYEKTLKGAEWPQRRQVMDYHTETTLPVLHRLATEYAVSDRWFSPVPAQTWPNRLFVHCATSFGQVSNRPFKWFPPTFYPGETIFRRLGKKVTDWACYNDQLPMMIAVEELALEFLRSRHQDDSHFRSLEQFEEDCSAGQLPRYSFIEPTYFFEAADDDHPPHDLLVGQQLIRRIYLAVRGNKVLWPKTLLLILYDEHGGFFDHKPPPDAPAPTPGAGESGFAFTRLGPRVPCILISAWTKKGKVFGPPDGRFFDHTSVITTLRERWPLGAPLTPRDAAAGSIWHALDLPAARTDDQQTFDDIGLMPLGEPPKEAWFFRLAQPGRRAAAKVAFTANLAGAPLLRSLPALSVRTGMNSAMAILAAQVAIRGYATRAGRRSTFNPRDAI